ncbi:MAG: bifunctional diguanylate cyclase/phosphodiesterase [Lachnospiraceae bacterium]|nr:bifunctional diguanylate cyclase/phosphodiesterase [Lachnospiraceae bacterium]
MKELDSTQKYSAIISALCWVLTCFSTFFWGDVSTASLSLLTSLGIGSTVMYSLKYLTHYRAPIRGMAYAVAIWALADFFYLLDLLVGGRWPVLYMVSDNLYTLTDICFGIAMTIYVIVDFKRQEVFRILVNAFLIVVYVMVILDALNTRFGSLEAVGNGISGGEIVMMIATVYMMAILLMLLVIRGPMKHPLCSYVMLLGLMLFTALDLRYVYRIAAGKEPESALADLLYYLALLIIMVGLMHPELRKEKLFEEQLFDSHKSVIISRIIGIGTVLVALVLRWSGVLNNAQLYLLLMAVMAYLVMWKTLQVNELNEKLIREQKAQNELLIRQVDEREQELQTAAQQLEMSSYLDSLTGLYNRHYATVYVENMIASGYPGSIALLSADINYFKTINDTYGYRTGDQTLVEYARRLSAFRGGQGCAFRVGADEFLLVVKVSGEGRELERLGAELCNALDQEMEINGNRMHLVSAVGISVYPGDSEDVDQLINFAESARRSIKHSTASTTYACYDAQTVPRMTRLHHIERRLQEADFDENFRLFYQPQVNAETGELIGMEALIRWTDKELGFVSPAEFIPIAEEMGVMIPLGEWINREAISRIKTWNENYCKRLVVGINVSPLQMQDPEFADKFLREMDFMQVPAEWLDLELTEGIAMNATSYNNQNLLKLREARLTFSVDDFGTGYATFANMLHFRFNRLKIAKELVDDLVGNPNARVVIRSITSMAKGMHMHTIAEGVEDIRQLEILRELGCEQIQGYYFGKPLPPEEFEQQWLSNG